MRSAYITGLLIGISPSTRSSTSTTQRVIPLLPLPLPIMSGIEEVPRADVPATTEAPAPAAETTPATAAATEHKSEEHKPGLLHKIKCVSSPHSRSRCVGC